MPPKKPKYHYENFDWPKLKFAKKATKKDWEVFLDKIQINDDARQLLQDSYLQLLDDFATHLLANIHWYRQAIVKEKTIRLAYILVSLSLLLLVPILVAIIQRQTESVSAGVTAIFTGIFALYQGVSSWLESRNVIAIYWQTKSNLMSRLYSLQDKWRYTHLTDTGWNLEELNELINDMREAAKFGIDCQKAEKQLFFNNYSYPQFNILSTIIGVRAQVSELFRQSNTQNTSVEGSVPKIIQAQASLTKLTKIADKPTTERTVKDSNGKVLNIIQESSNDEQSPLSPKIITRKDWGASDPNNPKSKKSLGPIKSIVIHHAAGYWDKSGTDDGKKRVLEIQKLHKSERKNDKGVSVGPWNDIGYHFLIDPKGNIYQGREFMEPNKLLKDKPKLIQGAHTGGFNSGRIGVCLLGNYESNKSKPTKEAQQAIIQLLNFLIFAYRPIGDTKLEVRGQIITGHRDFKATTCPGDNLYDWLEDLSDTVWRPRH